MSNVHEISSPSSMATKATFPNGQTPMSEKDSYHNNVSPLSSNGSENFQPEPWKDNRGFFRKLKDGWFIELLSCFVSMGASIALIFTLLHFDHQPLPKWPLSVTLNSLLALFTTVAKAGLLLPIAEAMGQLKWIWFVGKQRPLADFQSFDEASRGISGSLKLLKLLKGGHLASIGALVSILGLGTSFITQQMIEYPTRPVSDRLSNSTSPRADMYYGAYAEARRGNGAVDNTLKHALQNGLLFAFNETILPVAPSCTTGNCTWTPYSSLEVCSKVADVTDKLNNNATNLGDSANTASFATNVSLPNGAYFISETGVLLNLTNLRNASYFDYDKQITIDEKTIANHSIAFLGEENIQDTAIVNAFLIYRRSEDTEGVYSALEIMIYWCVATYETEVKNGVPLHNRTTSTYVRSRDATIDGNKESTGNLILSPDANNPGNYSVGFNSKTVLESALATRLKGIKGKEDATEEGVESDAAVALSSALYETISNANTTGSITQEQGMQMQLRTVENWAANIATSLSNSIRTRRFRGSPAIGTAYLPQTYVRVRWPWLAYLLTLLILSFVFLTATIYKTKVNRVGILKSSALAMVYGGGEKIVGRGGFLGRGELRDRGERETARLVSSPAGWRLE
ncbi:hypothetical protein B0O99DRAFT_681901 [Bisporella sp. PMI_857]|nr:hypothetical protein B0O99DRAFT_681901 [Bisporella sp. PMI_857]